MRVSPLVSGIAPAIFAAALAALSLAACAASPTEQPPPSGTGGGSGGMTAPPGSGGTPAPSGSGGTPAPVDAAVDSTPPGNVDAPVVTDTATPPGGPLRALIYTYRTGYRHTSAVPASMVLRDKLTALGFMVDIEDANNGLFTDANLAKYRLVIMTQSSGQPVGAGTADLEALTKWLKNGGALAGFHAATDVGYPATHPYVALMGGKFIGHPGGTRTANCTKSGTHPAIDKIAQPFRTTDEIYTYSGQNPANQVILSCEASGGGDPVPITWHRTEGAGRLFYTGLGHVDSLWTATSPFVTTHFWPGVLWAIGM